MATLDFKALFEAAPCSFLVLTREFVIAAASDAFLTKTLTKRSAIVGRSIFEVFPEDPADRNATGAFNLRDSLLRVLKSGESDTMAVQKYDLHLPDGRFEEKHWRPINTPIFGPDKKITHILHQTEDVTEFVRLTQRGTEQNAVTKELRAQAGKAERVMHTLAQEVKDDNSRQQVAHDGLEARVNAGTADLAKANEESKELRAQAGKAKLVMHTLAQEVKDDNSRQQVAHDGLEARVNERTADLARANEDLRREINEKTALQTQLTQSQKMEAVGRLAGGVAHDFNNLLTAIGGYSHFLLGSLAQDDKRRDDVVQIQKAGERAASLTRQLLAFSRQQVLQLKVLDCNVLVADLEKILQRIIGEDVKLTTRLSPSTGRIKADPGQIDQVLLNLVVNAKDAMPKGGKITVETSNVELGEDFARMHLQCKPGAYVMFAVTDTGTGMDAKTKSHLFEPFFTTKEQGKGTGLGLATVYGIVKQSGGGIYVYSELGHGTIFRIYFQRVEDLAQAVGAAPISRSSLTGAETILLVEDDELVRKFVHRALSENGYKVLVAEGPDEALRICRENRERIPLILTDVIMPKMHGPDLVKLLLPLHPESKVIYMSGYTDTTVAHHDLVDSGVPFLQKPLAPHELARKIREVLDKPI